MSVAALSGRNLNPQAYPVEPLLESRIAPILYGLQGDLDQFTGSTVRSCNREMMAVICAGERVEDNGLLSDEIHHTFSAANEVIRDFIDVDSQPQFVLTAHAVRAARDNSTAVVNTGGHDQVCFEAELRLARSLRLNERGKLLPPGHAPAGITYDRFGMPYGYIKSSGRHVGFAWRDAVVDSTVGEQHVPAGSFFTPIYDTEPSSVLDRYRSDQAAPGLISLDSVPQPDDIRIERFAAMLVGRQLASAAYLFATGPDTSFASHHLRQYIPEALDMSARKIGARVHALLRSDIARAA